MATIHWIGGTSTSFNDAANWSTDAVPGSGDTVLIDLAGTYTVFSNQSNSVASLDIISTATLDSTSGTFAITNGTVGVGIAGTLIVGDNTELNLGGTITETGTISEQSTADTTRIVLTTTNVTLTGGGALVMSANANNFIYGASSHDTLTNAANTISGSGNIGDGQMTLVNQTHGVIDADNAAAGLTINTGANTVVNGGLLEATAGANLVISSQVDNSSGGTIEASGAGSVVTLTGNVIGGTLKQINGGTIVTAGGGGQLDGITHPVTNAGNIVVADNTSFYLAGTINNTGTITLASTGDTTNLIMNNPTVTLTGGGQVVMSNNANNRIYGASGSYTLYNVNNTISGAGQLGVAQLMLDNAGTINANQTTSLTINVANESINTGLIEDTGSGGLYLQNTAIDNAGGTVQAVGGSALINLDGGTVQGGTLKTTGGATIIAGNGGIDGLSFGAITNLANINVTDNTNLYIAGTIVNSGTISLSSVTNTTNLIATTYTTTLTGAGTILLGNAANNRFYGSGSEIQLVNVSNTIAGAGQLGASQLALTNETAGVIDANDALALVVNTGGSIVVNQGLMESTGTAALNGGLVLQTTVDNAGGTIKAVGIQGNVNLNNSMTVEGGTLVTTGGATIYTNNAGLDGITAGTLVNNALVQVDDNTSLYLSGTIDNLGTIFVNAVSTSDNTNLIAASQTVDLTGGGQVVLSNEPTSRLYASNAGNTLVNVNNTISGAGQLGTGELIFVNEAGGVVDANQAASRTVSGSLVFNTGGSTFSTNLGLMEATNTGGLILQSVLVNTGGTILASGAGSHVDLNGGTVASGTLETAAGGVIDVTSSGRLDAFDYGTVFNEGSLIVNDNTSLSIDGTIDNSGTISLDSVNDNTNLIVDEATATLTGGGQIVLSDNGNNRIYATSPSGKLVNVNDTISGAGQFGAGELQVSNSGTVIATDGIALTLNMGGGTFTNNAGGAVIGQGAGGIVFSGGLMDNLGLVEALNGSAVTYTGGTDVNLQEGVLSGGTWEAVSSGQGATISLTGGAIATLSADVILARSGSTLQAGNGSTFTTLENSLTSITSAGILTLNNGRGYNSSLHLTDSGSIQLNGGSFHAGTLTIGGGGSFVGDGTLKDKVGNSGTIEALGGKLNITGNVTGRGALEIGASSTLELSTGASQGVTFLTGTGTLLLDNPAGFNNEPIGGLQVGDTIELAGTTVTAAPVNNGTLDVSTSGSTTYTFPVSGALAGNHFAITNTGGNAFLVLTSGAPVAHGAAELAAIGQAMMGSEFTLPGPTTAPAAAAGGGGAFVHPPEPMPSIPAIHGLF